MTEEDEIEKLSSMYAVCDVCESVVMVGWCVTALSAQKGYIVPPVVVNCIGLTSRYFFLKNLLHIYNTHPFLRHASFSSKLCVLYARFYGIL